MMSGGLKLLASLSREQRDRVFRIEELHRYALEWSDFLPCSNIDKVENWSHRVEIFSRLSAFRIRTDALPTIDEIRNDFKDAHRLAKRLKTYFGQRRTN